MIWLLTIGFGLAGYLAEQEAGLLLGALLGFLTGNIVALRDRVSTLERMTERAASAPRTTATPAEPTAAERPEVPDTAPTPPVAAPVPATPPAARARPRLAADSRQARRASQTRTGTGLTDSVTGLVTSVWRFFTTGNLVVKVGAAILFTGLAFLARYAMLHSDVPMSIRLSGIGCAGLALLALGWRLRTRTDGYGLVLQGAGVGVMYLTLFSAASMYGVLEVSAAFAGMTVLVAGSCLLAYRQHSQALATLATAGGLLTPVLISDGSGSALALFSYLTILNGGVALLAWRRTWRVLNWVGFSGTAAIAAFWGINEYTPDLFIVVQPFLITFFLLYVAIGALFSRQEGGRWQGAVDGSLLFGAPLAWFVLQAGAVAHFEYGLAFSSLFAAVVYAALLTALRRQSSARSLLGQSFATLAVVFASLVLPFAIDNQQWTAAAWAIEGAALIWIGARQRQLSTRIMGLALQVVATALAALWAAIEAPDSIILSTHTIALAALASSFFMVRMADRLTRIEQQLASLFVWWAVAAWAIGGSVEIDRLFAANDDHHHIALVLYIALSGAALAALVRFRDFALGQAPVWLTVPLLVATASWQVLTTFGGSIGETGVVAWFVALVATGLALYWSDDRPERRLLSVSHAGAFALLTLLVTWLASHALNALAANAGTGWYLAIWIATPQLMTLLAGSDHMKRVWPGRQYPAAYVGFGQLPALLWTVGWIFASGLSTAEPLPLGYLPIANPAELAALCALAAAWVWRRELTPFGSAGARSVVTLAIGGGAMVLLMTAAARTAHVFYGVPYDLDDLVESPVFQTLISILWTTAALTVMTYAARTAQRGAWLTGAGLLALTVLKLALVDLSSVGTVEQIVSFVSVGVLTLAIGYLAPLPPASGTAANAEATPERQS